MRLAVIAAALSLAGAASAQDAPKVVTTFPSQGSKVPPSVAELKVSYDHRMAASWSFATGGERAFPEGDNAYPIGPDYAHRTAPGYFNTRKTSIYGGSNEIQRNIIAKMVLGL